MSLITSAPCTSSPRMICASALAPRIRSASTMRMIDGGSTVPRVPALQTTPQARLLRYFAANIAGSASKPSVSTEAPTAPVVGASNAPRITEEMADHRKKQRDADQREADRETERQQQKHRAEHDQSQRGNQHAHGPVAAGGKSGAS